LRFHEGIRQPQSNHHQHNRGDRGEEVDSITMAEIVIAFEFRF
jgi:hypothetical protein